MYDTPPTCFEIQWPFSGIWLTEKRVVADYVTNVSYNACWIKTRLKRLKLGNYMCL